MLFASLSGFSFKQYLDIWSNTKFESEYWLSVILLARWISTNCSLPYAKDISTEAPQPEFCSDFASGLLQLPVRRHSFAAQSVPVSCVRVPI